MNQPKRFLTVLVLLFCFSAQAKNKPRKVAQQEAITKIEVVFGEKQTQFLIKPGPSGSVEFSNSFGEAKTKRVNAKDYSFIMEKINALTGTSEDHKSCSRAYIEITAPSTTYVSCLSSKRKLAKDMRDIANIMGLLF